MKIQHLAVIFVIIILPISLVLSIYTGNLIKVSNKQSSYDTLLLNSTYDAVRAYQMNTLNNNYTGVNESKIRDINASVNSFFNSLATGLSSSGYSKDDLRTYVPAMIYTLYDGYYVYGCYKNSASISNGKPQFSTDATLNRDTEYGLKSYVYYSCEYKNTDYDIIVNYSLDNYISVYGTYTENGEKKFISKSGYYIAADGITIDNTTKTVKKDNRIVAEPETLGEYISTTDNYYTISNNQRIYHTKKNDTKYYNYIIYNSVKYYFDDYIKTNPPASYKTAIGNQILNTSFNNSYDGYPVFRLENNLRVYLNKNELDSVVDYLNGDQTWTTNDLVNNKGTYFKDINAYYYYKNAKDFSEKLYPILSQINIYTSDKQYNDVIQTDTYKEKYVTQLGSDADTHVKTSYDTGKIFDYKESGNNPELESSSFNNHRIDVIVSSIESSLVTSIKNFNDYTASSFEYTMPVLSEDDWYTIANNMTVVSFLQGLTIGNYKYYSNYTVVANTKNNEFVSKDSIYVQDDYEKSIGSPQDSTLAGAWENLYKNNIFSFFGTQTEAEYHNPRCNLYNTTMNTRINNSSSSQQEKIKVVGYKNTEYDRVSFTYQIKDGNTIGTEQVENYYLQPGSSGYECIVSQGEVNTITTDDLIEGTKKVNSEISKAYVTALARERAAIYRYSSNLD